MAPFSLGERVMSKRTGLPQVVTVVGIIHPGYIEHTLRLNLSRWDEFYPDWRKSVCVMGLFDTPSKNVTTEEFNSQPKPDGGFDTYEELPVFHAAYYPIEDLEPL